MKIIKTLLALSTIMLFTGCVTSAHYTGKEPLKKNYGIVLASATADNYLGSTLYAEIGLVNIKSGEKIDLQNKVCRIKKDSPGMGLLVQLFIEDKEDQIEIKNHCGSLLIGEIKSGKYLLKSVFITSVNNAKGGYASVSGYPIIKKEIVEIKDGEIVYIGNVDIENLTMDYNYKIRTAEISMINNLERDKKIFNRDYPLLKKIMIKDSSIILESK